MAIVAMLGATISPYLFFRQTGQEVEDTKEGAGALPLTPRRNRPGRIHPHPYIGMAISNLVVLFIVITTATTRPARIR